MQPRDSRIRAHRTRPAHVQCMYLLQHILDPANSIGNDCSHAVWILIRQVQMGVLQCLVYGGKYKMCHTVGAMYQLALNMVFRGEMMDLTSHLNRQILRVKTLNWPDTGHALAGRIPERFFPDTIGRDDAKSGDDDTSLERMCHALFAFTIACQTSQDGRERV